MQDLDFDTIAGSLDRLSAPDVWDAAVARASTPSRAPAAPRSRRVATIVVAFAVFAAAGALEWRALAPGEHARPITGGPATFPPLIRHGSLPSAHAILGDRFVRPVELDGGALRVTPAPAGMSPPVSRSSIEDELWASPVFQGDPHGVLGWGLVTLTSSQNGIHSVRSVPAWVAFGWGGVVNCPMMTAAPSPVALPSSGYAAVVMSSPDRLEQPFSYAARSDVCGNVTGPTVALASHVESIRWRQVSTIRGGHVSIAYTPAPCGSNAVFSEGGKESTGTLTVEMTVPDAALPCPSPVPVHTRINVFGDMTLKHAPLGYVRQLEG